MTKNARFLLLAPAIALGALLAACGGGGSGSTPSSVIPTIAPTNSGGGSTPTPAPTGSATATPTPAATSTAAPLTVSGTLTEFTSGAPLSGFTVTVGSVPAFLTCLANQTASTQPCGVPAPPTTTTTTSSNGTFSIAVPAAGTYFLTIALNTTYATLHKEITVASGGLALGTVHVAALSSDEQNWLVDVNNQRASVSVPISFPNLLVDEYAEEQARATAAAIANGAPDNDTTGSTYLTAYINESGAILSAGGAITTGAIGQFVTADNGFMAEKANCPSGSWQTCTYSTTTGHYINISNTDDVWVGLGEAQFASSVSGYPGAVYDLVFPQDTFGPAPASIHRIR